MIVFNNWTLTVTGLIARQYDNLSRRIDVEGGLPAGYTWQLLVQSGGNADTILLEATETGAGALLTADNLSRSGEYYIQLRGVLEADGVTRRHTNVVSAYIPESLTGLGTWPEVPTEFVQVEARILELYQHPPIPGSNGYWLVWDADKDEYVESQLALPDVSVGPPGAAGFSPTVSLTETAEGVRIDVTDQEGTESATIKNGQDGAPGKDGAPGTDGAPGKDGSDGQAATLELTGAESLPAGSTPTVVEQAGSTAQARKYLLKIPSGADGKDGQDGQPGQDGASATVSISRIDLLDYGVAPTVTELDGSTSSARVYALGIPAGKPGDTGSPGADGVSPTVTVARNEADTGAVITAANADGTTTSVEVLDGADGDTYTLPIASSTVLGGVQPVAKTDAMTQAVGVDAGGALWTAPGGGAAEKPFRLVRALTLTEDAASVIINSDENGDAFSLAECYLEIHAAVTAESAITFIPNGYWAVGTYLDSNNKASTDYPYYYLFHAFSTPEMFFGHEVISKGSNASGRNYSANTNKNPDRYKNNISSIKVNSAFAAGAKFFLYGRDAT